MYRFFSYSIVMKAMLTYIESSKSIPMFLSLGKNIRCPIIFLTVWKKLAVNPIWAWHFLVWKSLIINSMSLINIGLLREPVSSLMSFCRLCLSKRWLLQIGWQDGENMPVHRCIVRLACHRSYRIALFWFEVSVSTLSLCFWYSG